MSEYYDAIIIGAGHNGLVAAAYFNREGKKVLLLEQREQPGGCLATEEFEPGFRASLATPYGERLRPQIVSDLNLHYYGLNYFELDPVAFCPLDMERHLTLRRDCESSVAAVAEFSHQDAAAYRDYLGFLERVRQATESVLDQIPVGPDSSEPLGLVELANLGVKMRLMAPQDLHALMRMLTSSLKDFLDERFETEALKAALAVPALAGHHYGPYAPGTAALLLYRQLAGPAVLAQGAMGGVTERLATLLTDDHQQLETGTTVQKILVDAGSAIGVVTQDGREFRARQIVSCLDPKRTFNQLVDPLELSPRFRRQIKNILMRGTTTIITLALQGLPLFDCLTGCDQRKYLSGRILLAQSLEQVEKASDAVKYQTLSDPPLVTATIPSLLDPSLAPEGQHVLQLEVRWTPYHLKSSWKRQKKFVEKALAQVAAFAPNLEELVIATKVLTPLDLETEYGLTEGHIFHSELNLHQLFFGRPLAGWAGYRTPIRNLFLCGSGTHPGGLTTGACGANAVQICLADLPGSSQQVKRIKRAVTSPVGASLAAAAGLGLLGLGLALNAAFKSRKKKEKEQA